MVAGDWLAVSDETDDTMMGFYATFYVGADNEQEALQFVEELQPDAVQNLQIDEVTLVRHNSGLKGVYSAGTYILFDDE